MEVLLGNFSIRHLNAVVVSSVAAAVTTRSLVGEERILSAPPHRLEDPRELLLYALLGLLAVAFALWFLRLIRNVEGYREPRRVPRWVRPLVAGVTIAALGVAEPRLLATGQDFVASLLRLGSGVSEADIGSTVPVLESLPLWMFLGLVALAKPIAATLTRSSGGSGGSFMPSLFIGAALGAGMAALVEPAWGFSEIDPGAFAVVGMAATFAAVARAPLTSIIIVFEITGDYGLVLPLMLASSLATVLADRYHPATAYTIPLMREGIHLTRTEDIDLLDTVTVGDVMTPAMTPLRPAMTVAEAAGVLAEERHHGLPVVDGDRIVGIFTVTDVSTAGGSREDVTVAEAMTAKPITVVPSMPVSAALARMAALGVGRLPVVADEEPTRCVGMFRRESVVRAYHHALGGTKDRSLYRERLRARVHPGATFFEIPVPAGSTAAGKLVRDLDWPEEAILVSVRRGGSVLIPHGSTVIRAGDTITAFGTSESRVDAAYLVEPSPPVSDTHEPVTGPSAPPDESPSE